MTLDGWTALSVETRTNRSTPAASAASSSASVPPTFTWTASDGWSSIIGTCLYAAAWKMTSGGSAAISPVHHGTTRNVREMDPQLTAALSTRSARFELALDQVEGALRAVDQDQAAWTQRVDLACQL